MKIKKVFIVIITNKFLERAKKWSKKLNSEKSSFIDNVEKLRLKAQQMDEQAKRKEKLINLNGGSTKNPLESQQVSNLIIDSLKAKLAILENVSKKN